MSDDDHHVDDNDDDGNIDNDNDFKTISCYFLTGYAFTRLPKSPYAYVILPTL